MERWRERGGGGRGRGSETIDHKRDKSFNVKAHHSKNKILTTRRSPLHTISAALATTKNVYIESAEKEEEEESTENSIE